MPGGNATLGGPSPDTSVSRRSVAAVTPVTTRRDGRPIEVDVVVALSVVQAALLVGGGIVLMALGGRGEVADAIEMARSDVTVAAWVLVALGVAQALLAAGLASGREVVRSIYAVVATLQLAPATYSLVALQDVRVGGVVSIVLSAGVLWLLYGAERTRRYFAP